ncbi:MAG: ADOP family duplicated permease [Dehalococcoidia bacterium]
MRFWAEIRERARAIFFRAREERELTEEIRFHIEMEAQRLLRDGHSPDEALRRARVAFGGEERFKEATREARGVGSLENAVRDARLAVRRLAREPGFTVPAAATIALGIGVSAAVFAVVDTVLFTPLDFPEPDRLVTISHSAPGAEFPVEGLSNGTFLHYSRHNRVFEEIGAYTERDRALTDDDAPPEQVRAADVSPSLLSVLRADPHLGRLLLDEDAIPGTRSGIIISHSLWQRRYGGDPGIVGSVIEIDRDGREVLGVMESGFGFPHADTDIWYTSWRAQSLGSLGTFYMNGVARLRPGISMAEAESDLARLVGLLPESFPEVTAARLEEMGIRAEISGLKESLLGEETGAALRLLLGIGVLLLLITWANLTNLCLARAARQSVEVSVTRMLGARGTDLARRFFAEGIALASIGGAAGLALAHLAVRAHIGLDSGQVPRLREVAVDGPVLLLLFTFVVLTAGLIAGASSVSARRTLSGGAPTGASGRMTSGPREYWVRHTLVVGQLALALTLLIGAALMTQSFWQLHQTELGFDPGQRIVFHLPTPPGAYESENHYHAQVRIHDEVLQRLRAIPGVEEAEAATESGFPLRPVPSYYRLPVARGGDAILSERNWPSALFGFATPGYFRAMGISVLRGRTFQASDTGREEHGVVLSESLARALFGDADALGQAVRWGRPSEDPDYRVVGVVSDVPSEAIRDGSSAVMYFPNLHPPQADTITGVVHIYIPSDEIYVLKTTLSIGSVLPRIRDAVREVDPKLVITQVGTLDALVAESMAPARVAMLLLAAGAATSLLLALIGIYGLLSYGVGQRTPELGIRIALGADPTRVVAMVVRQGAVLIVSGVIIGLALGLATTRLLGGLLFEVEPGEPMAFVAMALLLIVVALAATWVPARRAAAIDPIRAFKCP